MATVVCVRFKNTGKVYYFSPAQVWPEAGDMVIVETVRGLEIGETVTSAREVGDDAIVGELKPVIRKATREDLAAAERNERREAEAKPICEKKILEHKLDMHLVNVECTFDGSKIIFYFTSEGRVDFRDLVKDLAGVFHTRIELRQIGVRDQARFLGGLGICGRQICCGAFLSDFTPVSIKMAKEQNLSLNPTKISGQCGRLMCCLKYEEDTYEETLKKLPQPGKEIVTPDGIGMVTGISVIKEKVSVRIHNGDDFEIRDYAVDDVRKLTPAERTQRNQEKADRAEKAAEAAKAAEAKAAKEEAKKESADEKKGEKKEQKPRYTRDKKNRLGSTEEFMSKNGMKGAEPQADEAPAQSDEPKAE